MSLNQKLTKIRHKVDGKSWKIPAYKFVMEVLC